MTLRRKPASESLVLAALWLTVFSVTSQFVLVAPILPRISEQLGVPVGELGLLVSGYAFAVGIIALGAGPISDRVGRRRMLLVGTACMSAALALHAIAKDYPTLLVMRVLAGASGGVLTGAAVAYVGDFFPYERRGWANGWVISGMATGQILGIPIGSLLAGRFGFRFAFLLSGVTLALSCLMVRAFLPEPGVGRSREPLTTAGVSTHYGSLLARAEVRAAAGVYFLTFLGSAFYTLYLASWLEGSRNLSQVGVAAVFSSGGIATLIFAPRVGRLSDRIGRRKVIVAGSLAGGAIMLATPWLMTSLVIACTLFFALMALVAARSSPLDALLTEIVPGELRGTLMSLLMATGQLGFAAGGAMAGAAYAAYGYRADAFAAAATTVLVAALVWKFLPEPKLPADSSVGQV